VADGFIQLAADGPGKKADTEELVVGANTVHRERIQLAGAAAAAIAAVKNGDPAVGDYGLIARILGMGNVDHDAVDAGFPLKVGGRASVNPPTEVAVGDRVNAWFDRVGRLATFNAARETWVAYANAVAFANGKHHLTVMNDAASGRLVKVRKLFAVNLQTAAITGIVQRFDIQRCTSSSAGTVVTPQAFDFTNAALPAGVHVRTGATVGGGVLLYPWVTTSEEETAVPAISKSLFQQSVNIIPEGLEVQEHNLREGHGLTVLQNINSTVGTFGWIVVFTAEVL
jgi:hypothetical protein